MGFCRNWFLILIDPLHYLSSRFDFGFEFAEIFVIENDSPIRRLGESAFECLKENSASRGLAMGTVERITANRKVIREEGVLATLTVCQFFLLRYWMTTFA